MLSRATAAATSAALMKVFADNTGLITTEKPGRRYLWTDAYAVCNFLELARTTGDTDFQELALRLVDRVHHALGRYREDDSRSGWVSGLGEQEGEHHPTRGGLRIGKKLPERCPDEPFDDRLEWDRDGQYFHYLTKWMHALDSIARATRQPHFNAWARELAKVAHDAFTHGARSPGRRRMYWKMSIDLSYPLVAAMGQHDPLDGFITCVELRSTAVRLSATPGEPSLREEAEDLASMIDPRSLATTDPLGLGGLLSDAARVASLLGEPGFAGLESLMEALLIAAHQGLSHYAREDDLHRPASQRLAFRELGLAIGLSAIRLVASDVQSERRLFKPSARIASSLKGLEPFLSLGSSIESFWLDTAHRQVQSWRDHQDINDVMLASSLVPEGLLPLP